MDFVNDTEPVLEGRVYVDLLYDDYNKFEKPLKQRFNGYSKELYGPSLFLSFVLCSNVSLYVPF